MRDLDDTDMEILRLLGEDSRRSFSDIADNVDLSGPAVSARVEHLREIGIINRFTVDIDWSQLHAGIPVFVQIDVPNGTVDALRDQLKEAKAVEHIFATADGEIWFFARGQVQNVRRWLAGLLPDMDEVDYSVTLIDDVEWQPSLNGTEFALTCAECHNTVDSEGESTRIGGQMYHFCCPSCRSQFEDRYARLEEGA